MRRSRFRAAVQAVQKRTSLEMWWKSPSHTITLAPQGALMKVQCPSHFTPVKKHPLSEWLLNSALKVPCPRPSTASHQPTCQHSPSSGDMPAHPLISPHANLSGHVPRLPIICRRATTASHLPICQHSFQSASLANTASYVPSCQYSLFSSPIASTASHLPVY